MQRISLEKKLPNYYYYHYCYSHYYYYKFIFLLDSAATAIM